MASEATSSPYRFVVLNPTGSNWTTWQDTAKAELQAQRIWKFFDPTNPKSSPPAKFSPQDQKKIDKGETDASSLNSTKSYDDWWEDAEAAIAKLARLVDPIHVKTVLGHTLPKSCWDALSTRYANNSAQGALLLATKLTSLKFVDDNSTSITTFFTEFEGLIADLGRAGRTYTNEDVCGLIALAMPMSLQPAVSSLQFQEGPNAMSPPTWYSSLTLTWERLKAVRASDPTYVANRVSTTSSSNSRGNCHECQKPGHFARDCPTLTPEQRARKQERARQRKEGRQRADSSSTPAPSTGASDLTAQIAQLQAKIAALESTPHNTQASSGHEEHARVSILCASSMSMSEAPRLECFEHSMDGGVALKAGGGKIPAHYAAIDSGASRHCASERTFFANYRLLDEPRKVFLGDDRYILAVGEGDFRIWVDGVSGVRECLVFTRTLHVPDLACTLILIRQLTRDVSPPVHALFLGDSCEVY